MNQSTNQLSRGIIDALEHTPDFEAMMSGRDIVANSWGNLASQIVELGLIEPSISAVTSYLAITEDELKEPGLITDSWVSLEGFKDSQQVRWRKQYDQLHGWEQHEFEKYLDTGLKKYEVTETEVMVNAVQAEIDAQPILETLDAETESAALSRINAPLCLKRDALRSGLVISLEELVKLSVGFDGEAKLSPDEFAIAFNGILEALMSDYFFNFSQVPANQVVFSRLHIESFMNGISTLYAMRAKFFAAHRWSSIEDLVVAPKLHDLSLFDDRVK